MSEKLTAEQIIKAFENCELEKATLYLYNTKEEKVVFIPTVEIYELITRLCSENERLLQKLQQAQSETREEFAEKIKAAFKGVISCNCGAVFNKVNKILKEMESSK